jgi:molecular chaperone DnaK
MVTSTEKMLEENKEKATDEEATAITEGKDSLSKVLENEEASLEDIKNAIDELTKASQSFAEKLYAEAQQHAENNSSDNQEDGDVVEGEVVEEDE